MPERTEETLALLVEERTRALEHQLQRARALEQKSRINEQLLSAYLDTSMDLLFLLDDHQRVLVVNETLAQAWKKTKNDILNRPLAEVAPPAFAQAVELEAEAVLASGAIHSTTRVMFDRHFDVTLFRVTLTSGCMAVGGICRDVTDRVLAAQELERAVNDWQHTFDASNYAIWILDRENVVRRANRMAREMFGEETSSPSRLCWTLFHPEGRRLHQCPFERVKNSRHRESLELQFKDRWLRVTVDPIIDAAGELTGAVHIVSDITARRRAIEERERLEAQLLQAQKMESVGQLAGGVAHDFNNMLAIIIANAESACDELPAGHPAAGALLEILQTAQRSADLTRQLLAFARKQDSHPQTLNLNRSVQGSLKMLGRLIGEQIRIQHRQQDDDLCVFIDPAQLTQILVNLSINARDAIGGPGNLIIETRRLASDDAARPPLLPPGEWAVLRVTDDGCGMSQDLIAHIFEPFFSTKAPGRGTGLGLATVWGIVKQNNGFIQVDSSPGHGTTFTVWLPVGPEANQEAPSPVPSSPQRPEDPNGVILLVEDDAVILKLTRKVLDGFGFKVVATGSPLEALELAEKHQGELRLLVTDVIMPDMNGHELASRLRERDSNLQVLFMSGYPADVLRCQNPTDRDLFYLSKPFTRAALAAKLQEVLAARTFQAD